MPRDGAVVTGPVNGVCREARVLGIRPDLKSFETRSAHLNGEPVCHEAQFMEEAGPHVTLSQKLGSVP